MSISDLRNILRNGEFLFRRDFYFMFRNEYYTYTYVRAYKIYMCSCICFINTKQSVTKQE